MSKELDPMVLRLITYGLYVVSSRLGDKMNGQIVNTVFQVTSEPPCIGVSINKQNLTHEYISKSGIFSVSILDESTPMTFIGLFGFKSGRDVDKLCDVTYQKGIDDCPIVTEHALGILEVKVINKLDVGTHTLFIGKVINGKVLREGVPMTYAFYHQVKRGKAPKTAPTYIASTPKTAPTYIPKSD
jgi:flavin reductase (DIM6/NTAB) family NADH-FMN oxidoreductase RutF